MYGVLEDYKNEDEEGYMEDVNNVQDYMQKKTVNCLPYFILCSIIY